MSRAWSRGENVQRSKAAALCRRAARSLAAGDATALGPIASDADVLYAAIVRGDGSLESAAGPLASSAPALVPLGPSAGVSEPAISEQREAPGVPLHLEAALAVPESGGVVRVAVSLEPLENDAAATRRAVAATAFVLFGFGFVVGFGLVRPRAEETRRDSLSTIPIVPRDLGPVGPASGDASRPLVLVVEDDLDFRACLEGVLERGGFRVAIAGNADEAVRLAKSLHPMAVTLDVGLPMSPSARHASAADVIRALRSDSSTRHAAIVVVTGQETLATRAWLCRETGLEAPEVFAKTVRPRELLERLHALLANGGHDMPPPPGGRRRILVADDDPDVRWFLSKVLPRDRYSLESVEDGQQALDALSGSARKPDCLILDLVMPVKDGMSVIRELRARHGTAPVPIIIVTGFAEALERDAVTSFSGDGTVQIITKEALHLDPSTLLRALDRAFVEFVGPAGLEEVA
ncbi:MAG: response regulator transcription factor [Planctomycetes bacterium]|nr:response regulator transcription factor [Planctomycetota bacterium]